MTEDVADPSKRMFLKGLAIATATLALPTACTRPREVSPEDPHTEAPNTTRYFEMIEKGRRKKQQDGISLNMLNGTMPGIDLTYYENPTINSIRQLQDKTQRFMEMIGFLDVERSLRYSWPVPEDSGREPWYCNVYALDFARGLLGNEDIGYFINRSNSSPFSCGEHNLDWKSQEAVDAFYADYMALDSNTIDSWMRDHGSVNYGWEKVDNQSTLYKKLSGGAIAIGVTKFELIQNGTIETGHAFVLGAGDDNFFITQSTRNITLKVLHKDADDPQVSPESSDYHFWVHKLPD